MPALSWQLLPTASRIITGPRPCESVIFNVAASHPLVEMPGRGLEPLRIAPPDPKSGASANFATLAAEPAAVATIGHRRTLSRAVLPAIAESVEAASGRGLPIRNYPADSV